jgi:hypothetical protein
MVKALQEWTSIAASVVTLVALLIAWLQLSLNRKNQRETTAKATLREFLKLAVEYPEFAEGDYEAAIKAGKQERYEWFVGYFLWATEEIYAYSQKDAVLARHLKNLAKTHGAYFRTPQFMEEEYGLYSDCTQTLIDFAKASSSS